MKQLNMVPKRKQQPISKTLTRYRVHRKKINCTLCNMKLDDLTKELDINKTNLMKMEVHTSRAKAQIIEGERRSSNVSNHIIKEQKILKEEIEFCQKNMGKK